MRSGADADVDVASRCSPTSERTAADSPVVITRIMCTFWFLLAQCEPGAKTDVAGTLRQQRTQQSPRRRRTTSSQPTLLTPRTLCFNPGCPLALMRRSPSGVASTPGTPIAFVSLQSTRLHCTAESSRRQSALRSPTGIPADSQG